MYNSPSNSRAVVITVWELADTSGDTPVPWRKWSHRPSVAEVVDALNAAGSCGRYDWTDYCIRNAAHKLVNTLAFRRGEPGSGLTLWRDNIEIYQQPVPEL